MVIMQPNQPSPLPPLPPQPAEFRGSEYLDQIAAPTQTKTMKPWQLWGLIAGVLVFVVIVFFLILGSGGPSPTERYVSYLHRVEALRDITSKSGKTIQDSSLRGVNASTSSILGTAGQEGESLLSAVNLKSLPASSKTGAVSIEYEKLGTTLNDARLNAIYDQVYSREIGFQISKLRNEIKSIRQATKSSSLRSYLDKTDKNLTPLASQLSEFNE